MNALQPFETSVNKHPTTHCSIPEDLHCAEGKILTSSELMSYFKAMRIKNYRRLCRRSLHLSRVLPMGFLAIFFFVEQGAGPLHHPPTWRKTRFLDQGFLPLALDTPVSNCKAAVLVLVHPGYFISAVLAISGEHSPIRHRRRCPMED
jgi:hypothetical protein